MRTRVFEVTDGGGSSIALVSDKTLADALKRAVWLGRVRSLWLDDDAGRRMLESLTSGGE